MINLDAHIIKNDNIPWRLIENEAVLVDVKRGNVMQMNEVGAFIWDNIDGKNTAGQIIDKVCSEFEVDKDKAKEDSLEFLNELIKREIVKEK